MVLNSSANNATAAGFNFTCYDPTIFVGVPGSLRTTYIIAAAFNTIFCISAVVGNGIILAALRKMTSINPASTALLSSLALSDLMVGLTAQPAHIIYCIAGIVGGARVRCYSRVLFQWSSDYFVGVSFLTIVAISLDRYLALHLHLTYRYFVTRKKTVGAIMLVWVVCAGFPLGRLVSPNTSMILSSAVFVVFLVFPSLALIKIYRTLRQHKIQVRSDQLQQPATTQKREASFNVLKYKRSVITMLSVYFALILCFLPSVAVTVAWVAADQSAKLSLVPAGNFSITFLLFNSTLNPFLYCWTIKEVRKLATDLLKAYFCADTDVYA